MKTWFMLNLHSFMGLAWFIGALYFVNYFVFKDTDFEKQLNLKNRAIGIMLAGLYIGLGIFLGLLWQ